MDNRKHCVLCGVCVATPPPSWKQLKGRYETWLCQDCAESWGKMPVIEAPNPFGAGFVLGLRQKRISLQAPASLGTHLVRQHTVDGQAVEALHLLDLECRKRWGQALGYVAPWWVFLPGIVGSVDVVGWRESSDFPRYWEWELANPVLFRMEDKAEGLMATAFQKMAAASC